MYGNMKVVAVMMEKGGVGKTTLALNLALAAAEGLIPKVKKKILIFDFDDQQNASCALLGMREIPGVKAWAPPVHPAYDPDDPEDIEWGGISTSIDLYYGNPVCPYETTLSDRIEILPSDGAMLKSFEDRTSKISESQEEGVFESIMNELKSFMEQPDVQELYDLIIIDCPPGVNLITTPILRCATDLVIPVELEPWSVTGFRNIWKEIENVNNSGLREEPINLAGVVPNKYDPRMTTVHGQYLEQLRSLKDPKIKKALLDPIQILTEFKTQWLPLGTPRKTKLTGKAAKQMNKTIIDIAKNMYSVKKKRKAKKLDLVN